MNTTTLDPQTGSDHAQHMPLHPKLGIPVMIGLAFAPSADGEYRWPGYERQPFGATTWELPADITRDQVTGPTQGYTRPSIIAGHTREAWCIEAHGLLYFDLDGHYLGDGAGFKEPKRLEPGDSIRLAAPNATRPPQ